ncbi:MAG: spore germination protein [Clostridia bacterium]|nr:spore germination protein [Clostridia bacterium]
MTKPNTPLTAVLSENLEMLRNTFDVSSDLVIREISVAGFSAAVVSIEGMIDRHMMTDAVLLPLSRMPNTYQTADDAMCDIEKTVLGFVDLLKADTIERLSELIVSGFAAVLLDGVDRAVLGGLQAFMIRGVSEPSTEVGVRGSREGFTEAIRINVSMIRRRLKTPALTFEMLTVGGMSKTAVCLCYMRGRVSDRLLSDVRKRIQTCPLDIVLESGYLQPFLEGKRRSLFTGVDVTERPDTLCGKVAEGRIGVLVDGTPFTLVVPYLFAEHFQSMDDYTQHPVYASFIRLIKYVSFFISLLLPGLYVAIGTHHADMLPSELLLTFINSARSTPFPLVAEALLIHFLFEIMREAGLRFPKSVGHAVSIVGALVIGESVVRAGLVGAPMVIVVALTSISAFVIPSLYGSIAVLRFLFIVLGGALGLYGVLLGALLLLCSLVSLDVDTIPVTAPITPFSFKAMRDVFIRSDWRRLSKNSFRVQNVVGSEIKDGEEEAPQ